MKKLISYLVVFVLGFIVCAGVIRYYYGPVGSLYGPETAANRPRMGLKLASNGNNQVRDAAAKISAYVVNIDTIGKPVQQMGGGFGGFFGSPFGEPQEVVPRGKGSGVIFTPDGYILTNNHVVENAEKLTVTLHDGKQYPAKLIGRDSKTDLAVIRIDANGLKFAEFGNSDSLQVGDWVIAVGNALGLGPTVTVGVVSAFRTNVGIEGKVLEQAIQTDASINRGNSGGALSDINGDLVGINSAIASSGPDGGSIGIGFAIPSNSAKRIAEQLMKNGEVVRPWLGVSARPYDEELRKMLESQGVRNLPKRDGAMIVEIYPGSPAESAGLQPNDIIFTVNGKKLSGKMHPDNGEVTLPNAVGKLKIGDRILLDVWHASNSKITKVGTNAAKMPKQ